jgi:hypothetical protein
MRKDSLKNKEKYEGAVYESNNYGQFIVLKYIRKENIRIRFLNTGYEMVVSLNSIKKGTVKDQLQARDITYKNITATIGEGRYSPEKNKQAYSRWKGILCRCYSESTHLQSPTYKDCFVSDEWLNFQNFAKWFETNYVEGYHIDKDIKVEGNRMYGPDTCMFVSPQENVEKASAKNYTLMNPRGGIVKIYNMRKFCRDNSLTYSCMFNVLNGSKASHKGWTKVKE